MRDRAELEIVMVDRRAEPSPALLALLLELYPEPCERDCWHSSCWHIRAVREALA